MTAADLVQQERANLIKAKAAELGFDFCGVSRAEFLEAEAPPPGRLAKPPRPWSNGLYGQPLR